MTTNAYSLPRKDEFCERASAQSDHVPRPARSTLLSVPLPNNQDFHPRFNIQCRKELVRVDEGRLLFTQTRYSSTERPTLSRNVTFPTRKRALILPGAFYHDCICLTTFRRPLGLFCSARWAPLRLLAFMLLRSTKCFNAVSNHVRKWV